MSVRILTFLHSFESGGVERMALRLVEQWQKADVDAPLWMGRKDGPMRAAHEGQVRYEAGPQTRLPVRHFETLWMILLLPGVIRRLRPDALFCAGNSYAIVAVAMKLLLGERCPPVVAKISNDLVRTDMPWPARMAYRLWLRIQGRFIDRFVGMAEPMRPELQAMLKVADARVSIVADPVLDRLLPLEQKAASPGGLRFISIGRLAPQKDQDLMLRAFALGAQPEDTLCLVGDGPLEPRLRALASALGIADRVTFAGHRTDTAALLGASDIFLLSSRYEGVPAVIVEALAAGLPVIATDCAVSMGALLQDGAFGINVPVGQTKPLADAIASAHALKTDRVAAAHSVELFTAAHSAKEYRALFRQVVAPAPNAHRLGHIPVPFESAARKEWGKVQP